MCVIHLSGYSWVQTLPDQTLGSLKIEGMSEGRNKDFCMTFVAA